MPENPSPDWKKQGTGPAKKDNSPAWKMGAGKPAAGGPRDWQNQAGTPAAPARPRSKVAKLVIALGLFGVLLGLVIYAVYLWWPLKPACLMVLGSSYDVNLALPHNVYGWKSLQDLQGAADDTGIVGSIFAPSKRARLAYHPEEVKDKKSWEKIWGDAPKDFREETAILFLALHGGADAKGAFFFLDDQRGQDRLYFQDFLQGLKTKWPQKNVVLLLEPAQVAAHWPSGMLKNDFVRKLKEEMSKEAQPRLLVICASDASEEDQISWPSEEWRRTIFAHYVIEGLEGAADLRANGGDGNDRVTAGELFNYVKAKVAAWSKAQRGAPQTPIVLGGLDQDTRLVQIKERYTEKSPDDAPGKTFTPSPDLKNAWETCENLRRQVPGPAVYTPHLWRVYRDGLLRWEQLERAGDPTGKATALKSKLAALETEIQRKARVDVATGEITRALPLPLVLGFSPPWSKSREDLSKEFDLPRLWQEKDRDKQKKILDDVLTWAKAKEERRDEKGKLLYTELCRQLLSFLKDSQTLAASLEDFGPPSPEGESKARALVRLLEESFLLPRPAEVNYLVMLLEDLDPKAPPKVADLQLALKVRLLAEEAALAAPAHAKGHPYSEVVLPWIKNQIEAADQDRRLGEDLLFGSSDSEWTNARAKLDDAQKKYQAGLKDAAAIRDALDLRDRVLADFPYYAQWLAQRQLSRNSEQAIRAQNLIKQVEHLAKTVGDLTWFLDKADFQGAGFHKDHGKSDRNPDGLSPDKLLERLILQVRQGYDDSEESLKNKFTRICEDLQNVSQAQTLYELEAVLAVPLIEKADLRIALLAISRGRSQKLHQGQDKIPEEELEESAAKLQRQKRLALAALVPAWQENHPLTAVGEDRLGARIGDYWSKLPDTISENLTASSQSPDLKGAADKLREAEILCRLLPGGAVPAWTNLPFGPPEGLRRLRLHDLLLWQAQRSVDDHWHTEIENRKPYYVPAAKAFAQMAQDLAEAGTTDEPLNAARKQTAAAFGARVKETGLKVSALSNPNWTSEPKFPLAWRLEAEPEMPKGAKGIPMHWLQLDGPLAAIQDPLYQKRQPAENWLPTEPPPFTLKKPKGGADETPDKTKAAFTVVYRGQKILNEVVPRLWQPETIVNHFPPERNGLAFRLDKDFNYGAISFVLDLSGSMLEKYGDSGLRIDHAVKALETMLNTIPDNTYISLLAFVWDKSAEKTKFVFLQEPTKWRRAIHFQEMKGRLEEQIRRKEEFGNSPIAQGLVESRNKGFPGLEKDYKGPKTIIALTDGDDNDTYNFQPQLPRIPPNNKNQKLQKEYNQQISNFINKEFAFKEYEIHVICFNDNSTGEADSAQEQFGVVAQTAFTNPGSFVPVPKAENLEAALDNAIRPRLTLQQGLKILPGRAGDEIQINRYGSGLAWYLVPSGDILVKLKKVTSKSQDIKVHPGDLMILTLKRDGSKLFFERELFGIGPEKIAGQTLGPWAASVLRNNINGKGDLVRQLVTLEEESAEFKGKAVLLQKVPGFVWLEVKAKDSRPLGLLNWHRDYVYPAPAWSVNVRGAWPFQGNRPVPVDLQVWWDPEKYPGNSPFSHPLKRDPAQTLRSNFKSPGQIKVGTAQLRIEEVAVEDHEVGTGPEKKGMKSCLVMRLNHDPKKPVFVQLQADDEFGIGEEHRYYSGTNKYTALFWNLANPDKARFTFHVISLEDYKRVIVPVIFSLPPPTSAVGPAPVSLTTKD